MSGRRLNGWQRIGIVLSVIWAVGGTLWLINYTTEHDLTYANLGACLHETDTDPTVCQQAFDKENGEMVAALRVNIAFFVLAPIPVAWLLTYALIGLVRWIRRGFNPL